MTTSTWGPRLLPAPAQLDGAPPSIAPSCLPIEPTDGDLERLVAAGTPITGHWHSHDRQPVREVTFLLREPRDHDVVIHLNSLTDRHREDITGARMNRVPGTAWVERTYLLPDDGTFSYRFVSRPHVATDIGTTRDGWLHMHEWGGPDPHNAHRLPDPLGCESSVYEGSTAPRDDEWVTPSPTGGRSWAARHELDLGRPQRSTLWLGRSARPRRLVVLFDGAVWRGLDVADRLAARSGDHDLLLVESGSRQQRADLLPHADAAAGLVADALARARQASGRTWSPDQVVLAGQSYGGLAAATVVARRPDLAATAVVQSGSFWFSPDTATPGQGRGELMRWLTSRPALSGRFVVQVGSEEDDMVVRARETSELLRRTGATVSHREFRGGHDYAWWRHGLSLALDELDAR